MILYVCVCLKTYNVKKAVQGLTFYVRLILRGLVYELYVMNNYYYIQYSLAEKHIKSKKAHFKK